MTCAHIKQHDGLLELLVCNAHLDHLTNQGTFKIQAAQACDPNVLLQGPETSKVPKVVVRRGCKRSFGPRAPKSSCTGAKESCTGAKQGFGGAKDSWETFVPWVQNTFCTLS